MPKTEKLLYSRKETAAMLSISLVTLDRLLQKGKGPKPKRIGSRVLFSQPELARFTGVTA